MSVTGAVFPYPPAATDAAWKAVKTTGLRDKWHTELGSALRAAETAYGKIKFDILDVQLLNSKQGVMDVVGNVDVAKQAALAHYNVAVKPAIKALTTAHSKAVTAGRNPIISKASSAKAKAIAKLLATPLAQLKAIKFDDFDAEKVRLTNAFQQTYTRFGASLKSALDKGDAFVDKVRDTPTPAVFNAGIKKAARDITQNIANVEKLKKNGLDLGKPVPAQQLADLLDWAQDRNKLPDTANRTKVMATILEYDRKKNAVRAWWG